MRLERVIYNDGFGINKFFYGIKKKTEGIRFFDKNKHYFENGVRFGYEEWFNDIRFYI